VGRCAIALKTCSACWNAIVPTRVGSSCAWSKSAINGVLCGARRTAGLSHSGAFKYCRHPPHVCVCLRSFSSRLCTLCHFLFCSSTCSFFVVILDCGNYNNPMGPHYPRSRHSTLPVVSVQFSLLLLTIDCLLYRGLNKASSTFSHACAHRYFQAKQTNIPICFHVVFFLCAEQHL